MEDIFSLARVDTNISILDCPVAQLLHAARQPGRELLPGEHRSDFAGLCLALVLIIADRGLGRRPYYPCKTGFWD